MSKPINTVSLLRILKQLPTPQEKGIYFQVRLDSRDEELRHEEFIAEEEGFRKIEYRILIFRSVEIISKRSSRWFEWELLP